MALGMPNRYATFINCPKIIQKKSLALWIFFWSKQSTVGNVFKNRKWLTNSIEVCWYAACLCIAK